MIKVEAWGTIGNVLDNSIMEHPRLVICLSVSAPNLDIQCNVTKRALDYWRPDDDVAGILSDVWATVSDGASMLVEIELGTMGGLHIQEPAEKAIRLALAGLKCWFGASQSQIVDLEDRLVANHFGNRAFAARVMAGLSAGL